MLKTGSADDKITIKWISDGSSSSQVLPAACTSSKARIQSLRQIASDLPEPGFCSQVPALAAGQRWAKLTMLCTLTVATGRNLPALETTVAFPSLVRLVRPLIFITIAHHGTPLDLVTRRAVSSVMEKAPEESSIPLSHSPILPSFAHQFSQVGANQTFHTAQKTAHALDQVTNPPTKFLPRSCITMISGIRKQCFGPLILFAKSTETQA
ncbi:tRNA methyltransferase [Apiospora arundinis]